MIRRRLAGLFFAAAMTAGVGLAFAGPASADTQGPIRNVANHLCLTPVGGSQGAAVVQEPCETDANGNLTNRAQEWDPVCVDSSCATFHVQNHESLLCLDARGGAANGTPIQVWTCNSISNEKWDYGPNPGAISPNFELRSRVSGTTSHCLDEPGAQTAPGLAMQLYVCNGTAAQIWDAGPGVIE